MKNFFVVLLVLTGFIAAQNITERSYNCIFNVKDYSPLQGKGMQAGDEVDALFDKAGLTSADARKANVWSATLFTNSPSQTFTVKKSDEEGYYHIIHKATGKAVTVEDASKADGANVTLFAFSGMDHQKFAIQRDTAKHRYASYVIAKHSGLVLTTVDKGNVVQKPIDRNNDAQVWAFSTRYAWHNGTGYLTVGGLFIMPGAKVVQGGKKNRSWCYIALPSAPNLYYVMNAMSHQFLIASQAYDKNNILEKYTYVQRPYKRGITNNMLFSMQYTDDTKESLYIIEYLTKYVLDVDPATKQIVSVPKEKASKSSHWGLYNAPKGM